jgi:hypothetical protein
MERQRTDPSSESSPEVSAMKHALRGLHEHRLLSLELLDPLCIGHQNLSAWITSVCSATARAIITPAIPNGNSPGVAHPGD